MKTQNFFHVGLHELGNPARFNLHENFKASNLTEHL